ncbi:NYN domain-containing protein [Massilia yuzhufengensis]|uniref:NYN domain-containing protein n=1 Tax=Massilia yuzhufengensis TaxID=1164594 RepID=A0A1I1GSN3_9BURK|nr:NYN domain-containing protein [Massilia yuzhufengensis]SFC14485.1 NYN domain-containing protein [Massilia yuzhufengensis]
MASSDNISMAVFCDFENVALGVRDANYEKFDIKPVLERLLLKGSIVVKKAYCDWDRYKGFKAPMHEANFEMIEIPHVRQSGKNSADIRLVVDALDLCYTKSHVDTFVIISGDSDFSPLVSKLRENAKRVIGVGVKQSTSDLLVANCDEFIFYDDLVREVRRVAAKRDERKAAPQNNKRPTDDKRKEELEARKVQALEMVVETFDALISERGDTGKIWASLLKDTLKRRRPDFSETYYGFRTFGNLLEEAQTRGLFEFGRDEKSGTYVFRSSVNTPVAMPAPELVVVPEARADEEEEGPDEAEAAEARPDPRRRRGGRNKASYRGDAAVAAPAVDAAPEPIELQPEPAAPEADVAVATEDKPDTRRRSRGGRNKGAGRGEAMPAALDMGGASQEDAPTAPLLDEPEAPVVEAVADEVADAPAPAAKERRRAPRKPAARKAAAAAEEAAVVEEAVVVPAPAEPAPVAAIAPVADDDYDDDTSDDVDGNVAEGTPVRKKPAGSARKPAARGAAPRGRRPAKPKA